MIPVIDVRIRAYRKENGGVIVQSQVEEDTDIITKIDYAMVNMELDAIKERLLGCFLPDAEVSEFNEGTDTDQDPEDGP